MTTDRIRGARYGTGCGAMSPPDQRRERGRRRDDGAWTSAIVMALLILGIGMMIGYGWRAYQETPDPARRAQISPAEKRWLNERFKFHGISACIEENGEHYFIRNGKRCKL